MKTAVIYARYSSDRQTEQSIEGQLRVCNDYAKKNDIYVIETYIDRAMTGTNDNRTSFQKMLRESNKKAWNYVLVYKLDRFSRNKYEMAMHKKTLRDNGVKLISCMENIPDTPEGIILESLLEGMAEYYSAELSQKVKRGMRETMLKGNFLGGYMLFGYKVQNKKIVIEENEAEVVRWIFNEYCSGTSVKTINQELLDRGILCRGKPFTLNSLYYMLNNEKYSGVYKHDGEVFPNMYPQIVPKEIFEAVQSKINNNKYGRHNPEIVYLLKNKVRCGYCNKPVNSETGTSKNGSVKRYYKCSSRKYKVKCCLKPIRKEILEDIVLETVLKAFSAPKNISVFADSVLELVKKQENDDSVLNLIADNLNRTERAISNILDCMEQGMATESTKERLQELENKKNALTENLIAEKAKTVDRITKEDITNHITTALKKSPQQIIDLLIKQIRLYNDKIEIDFHFLNKNDPDDDNRWGVCFYECKKSFGVQKHYFDKNEVQTELKISLFV